MSVNVSKRQIVNYNDPINIYNLSNSEIESQTAKFKTTQNIGKYIIFIDENLDNGGYVQMDEMTPYKGKKIINESTNRNDPFITLQDYIDVYVIRSPYFGGKSKRTRCCCKNRRRSSRRRKQTRQTRK